MERTFSRDLQEMDAVFAFVDRFAAKSIPSDSIRYVVKLALEEIFTNMVRHNASGAADIGIDLEVDGGKVIMTLTDHDAERFDLTEYRDVDVRARLSDREPGGLGIHLVRHMMDEITYHYRDRKSVVTLIKNMDTSDAED